MKKYWLLIVLAYSLFFCLIPPLQTPDENDHYETVYWLSKGIYPFQPENRKTIKPRFTDELYELVDLKMTSPDRNLNLPNFSKINQHSLKNKTSYSQTKQAEFKAITLQSYQTPLYHLSAVIFFKIGQGLKLSLWHLSYFTRLTSALYYFALVYLAYLVLKKLFVKGRAALFLWLFFCLNPHLIRSGVAINPDIGVAFWAMLFLWLLLQFSQKTALLALVASATALSKFSGIFTIPVGLVNLWRQSAKVRHYLVFLFFSLVPLLPWFYLNYYRYGKITTTQGFFIASSHEIVPRPFFKSLVLAFWDFRHTLMHFSGFLGAGNERYPFKFFFIIYAVTIAVLSLWGFLKLMKKQNPYRLILLTYGFFYLAFLYYLAFFFQKSGLNWDIQGRYFLNGFFLLTICLGYAVKPKYLAIFALWHYLFILSFVLIPGYYV